MGSLGSLEVKTNMLFTPLKLGDVTIPQRVILAPLTRQRADPGFIPSKLALEYYKQRAKDTFIISEGTQISQQGSGYPNTPGIYNDQQVEKWQDITDAVHKQNGVIYAQLWHVGRVSHTDFQPGNKQPVSSTANKIEGIKVMTYSGEQDYQVPRALTLSEIKDTVEDYRKAAENAKKAGFDGVEIHSAHGYLLNQFLDNAINQRTDEYGGSIENRARIVFEVIDAVTSVWPNGCVGIRYSPTGRFMGPNDSDLESLYTYLIKKTDQYNLSYISISEPRHLVGIPADEIDMKLSSQFFKKMIKTPVIAAGGYDAKSAEEHVSSGNADGIAFGRYFISNPDLPERIRKDVKFTPYDRSAFYGQGAHGYIDYPFMEDKNKAKL